MISSSLRDRLCRSERGRLVMDRDAMDLMDSASNLYAGRGLSMKAIARSWSRTRRDLKQAVAGTLPEAVASNLIAIDSDYE